MKRGSLRVAMPSFESPPFFFQGKEGVEGTDVDIVRGIAHALSVRLELVREAISFNAVVENVIRGDVDMGIGKISRTLARARFVRFSDPYAVSRHALLLNRQAFASFAKGQNNRPIIRRFDGSLGVIKGSSFADQTLQSFPQAKITLYERWEQLLDALVRGEVIAAYRDEAEMQRLLQQKPDLSLALRVIAFTDMQDSLSVVLPQESSQLLSLVNLYLAQRSRHALPQPHRTVTVS
jgi:ABC-type amino acid transport substrate-binding protein